MKDMWSKLFGKILFYEQDFVEYGRFLDRDITQIIEPLKQSMTEEELDVIKDMMYSASYSSEKYGFYLGIRTALRIHGIRMKTVKKKRNIKRKTKRRAVIEKNNFFVHVKCIGSVVYFVCGRYLFWNIGQQIYFHYYNFICFDNGIFNYGNSGTKERKG